eukprot:scaffold200958_cov22-Tisochrysis_lutea.AAC.1
MGMQRAALEQMVLCSSHRQLTSEHCTPSGPHPLLAPHLRLRGHHAVRGGAACSSAAAAAAHAAKTHAAAEAVALALRTAWPSCSARRSSMLKRSSSCCPCSQNPRSLRSSSTRAVGWIGWQMCAAEPGSSAPLPPIQECRTAAQGVAQQHK